MRRITRAALQLAAMAALILQPSAGTGRSQTRRSKPIASPASGSMILTPDIITDEGGRSHRVRRGLLFVPENRRIPGSRIIAVHFAIFPSALAHAAGRPPVFLLPGGPGWDIDFSDPLWFDEIERLRRTRDVVYVSQRGYAGAPGLVPDLRVTFAADNPQVITSAHDKAERDRATLAQAITRWQSAGVDLTGYDILNITADVNDLRRALGHRKIVLRGCSFGSQWSLAYMARWPETVDRAMLSGVEPLNDGYDSPDWIWASMTRVAEPAESTRPLAEQMPPGGLMAALRTVIARLEAQPETVTIRNPVGAGELTVAVGADDLRALLTDLSLGQRRARDNLAQWPRFILEIYAGDLRFLAVRTALMRSKTHSESLMLATINHSVGIDAHRAADLQTEAAARWLGDINLKESVTRSAAPTIEVDDAFRRERAINVPTLLIAGDYDWSTPIENAERLARRLRQGKLVTVLGGRHCTETNFGELAAERPVETQKMYSFINADFDRQGPSAFLKTLPDTIELPRITFAPSTGKSLYDAWLARR